MTYSDEIANVASLREQASYSTPEFALHSEQMDANLNDNTFSSAALIVTHKFID